MSLISDNQHWSITPTGDARGYIKPHALNELWFHTGTKCNLECDFCLEGSSPSDKRLQTPKFDEIKPYIDEALTLGVEQFSFTGGEPFLAKDIVDILDYASKFKPCIVLTNGTDPLFKRIESLKTLQAKNQHAISFRISIDSPIEAEHDNGRGTGNFAKAFIGMRLLHNNGFNVSLARHMSKGENTTLVDKQYQDLFELNGLPFDTHIVAFPDFLPPGSLPSVPHITTTCMTSYQTEVQRKNYMCATSKMIIKKNGQMQVYACTLVDDDEDYFQAITLVESMTKQVNLKHHRCYSCFAFGASCSEM
ncbi:radical SAM protein [Parashewanella spongiae]|uniref:Radical SAM protein n=1 Tax=Parashewanella spongiae TaxID=342950 RepID=A0A3A6U811_9GAMM|nr:radical SAM protein [Parashewanella spongiae]MCL1077743.1 radical SAM protein [Parashewanella spongiae]RJY18056.1 radical SAM protein [Parashewanella spongiae]